MVELLLLVHIWSKGDVTAVGVAGAGLLCSGAHWEKGMHKAKQGVDQAYLELQLSNAYVTVSRQA